MYEYATEDSQKYKEGRVILERALIKESEGFIEHASEELMCRPTYRTDERID